MGVQKKGVFDWYFKSNLLIRISIGLIVGVIAGMLLAKTGNNALMGYIKPFGDAFIRLLKMIIVPVVFFTLVVGTSSTQPSRLGRIGAKIMIYYLLTTLFAAILGLVFGKLFNPGTGISLPSDIQSVGKAAVKTPLSKIILELIPENIFTALTQGTILQIIFFALIMGIALAFLRDTKDDRIKYAADTVFHFFEGMSEVMFKVVGWVMQYAPIGVFALMVTVFGTHGAKVFGPLLYVTVAVYIAIIAHLFIVYGGMLATRKMGIIPFVIKARTPIITAFVTRSSGGTLPISIRTLDNMGVSKPVYSFTLPVGATINMDGTTIYQAICAVFIANAVGVTLSLQQMVLIVITVVLASVGTAGVPGAGALMLLLVLEAVGLRVEAGSSVAAAYAMILGIDALLDMARTGLNVAGDLVGTTIVADTENELDRSKYIAYKGD